MCLDCWTKDIISSDIGRSIGIALLGFVEGYALAKTGDPSNTDKTMLAPVVATTVGSVMTINDNYTNMLLGMGVGLIGYLAHKKYNLSKVLTETPNSNDLLNFASVPSSEPSRPGVIYGSSTNIKSMPSYINCPNICMISSVCIMAYYVYHVIKRNNKLLELDQIDKINQTALSIVNSAMKTSTVNWSTIETYDKYVYILGKLKQKQ